ncbi:GSCOCG00004438001-RA-CDS [Cotesia congregata]|nr:GSCOCG00004438001-RA-CDS [Cotesia congregata]
MNYLNFLVIVCSVSITTAATRYLAIPIDGMDIIEVNPQQQFHPQQIQQRPPRQTEAYIPQILSHGQQLQQERQQPRIERSPILDYVDFGAQTGNNGAYNWFVDYPAHR